MNRHLLPLALCWLTTAAAVEAGLPRVVLVGDSIRHGYAPLVEQRLQGKAKVISPKGAGDSAWLLKNLDALVLEHNPDVVHFNVGLHDLRFGRQTKAFQVERAEYIKNLEAVVARLRKQTKAALVFASTTPIDDARHAKRGGTFDRFEEDVHSYNTAALFVMSKHGVVVHDLHALVKAGGMAKLLDRDGTHCTAAGKQRQADAVADCVLRQLAARQARPGKAPAADQKATDRYTKAEADRDALVPPAYRKLQVGEFAVPASAAEWKKRRPEVLKIVAGSLGDLPSRPRPSARLIAREIHPHFELESLAIPNGDGAEMTALLLLPRQPAKEKRAAILWLHSSSYDRHQLLMPGFNGGDEPLGQVFAKAGYVVLAPDAAWYGGRAAAGPSGAAETGRAQQESLLKLNLWLGRTLWGMFVHDDRVALDYLCSRAEVDVQRIGATGMSMGSTRAWWLQAVDDRIACGVGVACLTRYQNLIAHGGLRQHGVYYFVNGLLRHFDSEAVIALIAPRPFLALNGELDAGSPADGIRVIEQRAGKVYEVLGVADRFVSIRYEHVGHTYTPAMRKEMLAWFAKWLKP